MSPRWEPGLSPDCVGLYNIWNEVDEYYNRALALYNTAVREHISVTKVLDSAVVHWKGIEAGAPQPSNPPTSQDLEDGAQYRSDVRAAKAAWEAVVLMVDKARAKMVHADEHRYSSQRVRDYAWADYEAQAQKEVKEREEHDRRKSERFSWARPKPQPKEPDEYWIPKYDWKKLFEEDQAKKEAQSARQAELNLNSYELTPPGPEEIAQYISSLDAAFENYATLERFPSPPAWTCTVPFCDAQRRERELAACSHQIAYVFRGSDLKKLRRSFHPDRFSANPNAPAMQRQAQEVFVALDAEHQLGEEEDADSD
ncbi:uncharacterized protein LTR77_005468 [Saxophila tyrrhenica]|uniref:Uncharacterized protein n=1 Tax=Saxophila tyrrhenica TaxID=1690608 RepID=A0AAV9PBN3_9PEZI|nr:hypothetical protein LTR77_005468 [Saxophila tyrrhenica]